jgi:hypothetical protein
MPQNSCYRKVGISSITQRRRKVVAEIVVPYILMTGLSLYILSATFQEALQDKGEKRWRKGNYSPYPTFLLTEFLLYSWLYWASRPHKAPSSFSYISTSLERR